MTELVPGYELELVILKTINQPRGKSNYAITTCQRQTRCLKFV
jgi:hypothetical protein